MSAHTPGPWRRGKCYQSIVADAPVPGIKGSDDVEAYGGNLIAESVATQNIPLIAAAPELLNTLRELVEIVDAAISAGDWKVDGCCDPSLSLNWARATIAKAGGRA